VSFDIGANVCGRARQKQPQATFLAKRVAATKSPGCAVERLAAALRFAAARRALPELIGDT
jgi:hypothetical protein